MADNFILLSTAYFPPVDYFVSFIDKAEIVIEGHENFIKQTYRNRCLIYGPGGIQQLTVPVERGSFHKVSIKDLKIDYSRPWQKSHIRTLKTAYNSSAFFEFFHDDIFSQINTGYKYLLDMNMSILELMINLIEYNTRVLLSDHFSTPSDTPYDLRYKISPKEDNSKKVRDMPSYFQVFSEKHGFIPDLSILDLIFNMGPESYSYLVNCGQILESDNITV